jgi:hypothetical protein
MAACRVPERIHEVAECEGARKRSLGCSDCALAYAFRPADGPEPRHLRGADGPFRCVRPQDFRG